MTGNTGLQIVREFLGSREDIVIVREVSYFDPNGNLKYLGKRGQTYTVHFVVAPRGRTIHNIPELKKFMETLSPPDIEHEQSPFMDLGWGPISLGYLYFEEEVGSKNSHTKTKVVITDPELLELVSQLGYNFVDGRFGLEEKMKKPLKRFVAINPMPSEEFAIALVNGVLRYTFLPAAFNCIGRKDFMEYISQQGALENLVR